jgi:hypothetical protein
MMKSPSVPEYCLSRTRWELPFSDVLHMAPPLWLSNPEGMPITDAFMLLEVLRLVGDPFRWPSQTIALSAENVNKNELIAVCSVA